MTQQNGLRKAERRKAKIRVGLAGSSGSGKTMSALKLAKGLVGDWSKIAILDTEHGSGDLYSSLGDYNVRPLEAPFTPERYIEAIEECEAAGMEAIIIDSITHEWDGKGGILDVHSQMAGNSFTNWAKLTPRHNKFIEKMLQSPVHIIATMRTKQDYVLVEKNGRQVPEKVGLKAITRDGVDYELTLVLDIDIKHMAVASKDRTGLFAGKPDFVISEETGSTIRTWCESGAASMVEVEIKEKAEARIALSAILAEMGGTEDWVIKTYGDLQTMPAKKMMSIATQLQELQAKRKADAAKKPKTGAQVLEEKKARQAEIESVDQSVAPVDGEIEEVNIDNVELPA